MAMHEELMPEQPLNSHNPVAQQAQSYRQGVEFDGSALQGNQRRAKKLIHCPPGPGRPTQPYEFGPGES